MKLDGLDWEGSVAFSTEIHSNDFNSRKEGIFTIYNFLPLIVPNFNFFNLHPPQLNW